MPFGAERYFERRRSMDRVEFETALREEGYLEVADRKMEPNKTNPEHSHEFDARLLILEGAASGKLKGKRVALKDNICLAGVPMMNGASTMQGYVPDVDATVVTRI